MRIPRFFTRLDDVLLLGRQRVSNRLRSGRMAAFRDDIRLTFGTSPQSRPAVVVIAGAGTRKIRLRCRSAHPAAVRFFAFVADDSRLELDVDAAAGARLALSLVVLGAADRFSLIRRVTLGEDARLDLTTLHLAAGATNVDDRAVLTGPAASLTASTLVLAGGDDVVFAAQEVRHEAPRTTSRLANALVALGAATLRFDVVGAIGRGHAGSDCRQDNRGVILGENAQIEVSPKLLIDEFDVQAGHGCAIGRINAEELYYLTSRGLDETTAKRLIVAGFTAPFLAPLLDPDQRRMVTRRMSSILGGSV